MQNNVKGSRPLPWLGIASPLQLVLIGLLLLVLVSGVKADNHLRVIESGPYHVRLSWTAPGDDHNVGQATKYDIRHYYALLSEQNWDSATIVDSSLIDPPRPAGSADSVFIEDLTPDSLYFLAIKTADEVPNWSEISTVISFRTPALDSNGQGKFVISNERITDITAASAVVRWSTSLPATSQVVYGMGEFSTFTLTDVFLDTVHAATLDSLSPASAYICHVVSGDGQGNFIGGNTLSFETEPIVTRNGEESLSGRYSPVYFNHHLLLVVNNIDQNRENYYKFQVSDDPTFASVIESSPAISQGPNDTTFWRPETEFFPTKKYLWRASVNDGSFFEPLLFEIQDKIYVYPNPFNTGETNQVTFVNIPSNASLSIFTMSGELVRRFPDISSGSITWDGTNGAGRQVASEKYLWYIEGTDIKGKIILIR